MGLGGAPVPADQRPHHHGPQPGRQLRQVTPVTTLDDRRGTTPPTVTGRSQKAVRSKGQIWSCSSWPSSSSPGWSPSSSTSRGTGSTPSASSAPPTRPPWPASSSCRRTRTAGRGLRPRPGRGEEERLRRCQRPRHRDHPSRTRPSPAVASIVTIVAPVNMFFMRIFGITPINVTRISKAEFVLPVPMGSPEN